MHSLVFQGYFCLPEGKIFLILKLANITSRFTFHKSERLKSRKLIEQLFREGRSFSKHPFKIIYIFSVAGIEPLQAGFAVSKKYFKKAVDRNRVKRLMREAYRLQKNLVRDKMVQDKKYLQVFFIYTGNDLPEYKLVVEKISAALQKLQHLANENISSNT